MNTQRIVLISVIVGLAIALLLLLGTKLFFLILAGGCFYGAHRFDSKSKIQGTFVAAGIIMLLVWFGTDGAVEFVEGGKKVWETIFPKESELKGLGFNFLVPLFIILGLWIYKKGSGFLGWKVILCLALIAAWIGGQSQVIVDGFNNFKKPITEGADPINAKGFSKGANKLLESAGKAMEWTSQKWENREASSQQSQITPSATKGLSKYAPAPVKTSMTPNTSVSAKPREIIPTERWNIEITPPGKIMEQQDVIVTRDDSNAITTIRATQDGTILKVTSIDGLWYRGTFSGDGDSGTFMLPASNTNEIFGTLWVESPHKKQIRFKMKRLS